MGLLTAGARWRAAACQLWRLPGTLLAIRRMVGEDYSTAALDENLWSFLAFHEAVSDPYCRARPWRKARLAGIGPGQVQGMTAGELASMLHVAMEIEEPILEYSRQNGEGFRRLLPNLGRYMGMNREEADYAAARGLPWCESPWCAEERRHANTFARIIEKLTGEAPVRNNPNVPWTAVPEEEDAARMLAGRESAEWNSSSTYTVMAAHAEGDLHHLIRNVARDEIKHLSILSAAGLYLGGPRPWGRFVRLVKRSLAEYRGHQRKRSRGEQMGTNPITSFEVMVCHLLTERAVRRWLQSLPPAALTSIFETPSRLPELPPGAEGVSGGEERRRRLARWEPGARREALAQRAFEEENGAAVQVLVETKLGSFREAGIPGSEEERRMVKRIRRLGRGRMRGALTDRLRRHQIENNRHVLQAGGR